MWDTSGSEKYQSLGYAFYRGSDGVALVFDITNQQSFENLSKWKDGFLANANPEDPQKFPFVVIGNKCELEEKRQVQANTAREWC